MVERVESVVVGAGVIGLAVARRLALSGQEVLLLEAARAIGTETSSRNSEVIHAGIYYTPGSLKARLSVRGRHLLYEYCASHGIAHRRTGKLIVATRSAEEPVLEQLAAQAAANGARDLRPLSGAEAIALEPALACTAALLSPSTGILDSHGLMLSLLGEAEDHGAALALQSPLLAVEPAPDGFRLTVDQADGGTMPLSCRRLVNAAGHGALPLARRIAGLAPEQIPAGHLLKGNYFSLSGKAPFRHLIYPVPVPGGAGTHLTLDLAGQARFGPDTEPVESFDYRVDPARAASFYGAIRRYYPGLKDDALAPAYAGIRPKIGKNGAMADFIIAGPESHGLAGLVNLFGIESPGLTASLAIAEEVAARLAP